MLGLLVLWACTGVSNDNEARSGRASGGGADSASSGEDTSWGGGDDSGGGSARPLLQAIDAECDGDSPGSTCTWTIRTDGATGAVELQIIETGDPGFVSGCNDYVSGGIVCGVWSEYHNDFALVSRDNGFGGDTRAINLELVRDYRDQVNNRSTLFSNSAMNSTLTALVTLYDSYGNVSDCLPAGHNPGFFTDLCENARR